MLIYLIRHGESEANRAKVHAGWGDWNLTDKGREQARAVGERLRKLPPFDRIYVSDLPRTVQTFEEAFGADTPHILSPLVREINSAPFVGIRYADLIDRYGDEYLKNRIEMDYSPYGGENPEHMEERVRRFYEEITAEEGVERVAVVCHGGVIRCSLGIALGVPARQVHMRADNCGVTVLRWLNGVWTVMQFNHTPEIIC